MQGMRKLNVLIVDDQAGVRLLLETIVKDAGQRAYVARNGLEAVRLVNKIKPDLVFLDVRMPVMDGLEALRRIKSANSSTNVIVMTAFGKEETFKEAMDKGAWKCILKPFDIDQIRDFIAKCADNLETDKNMLESRTEIVSGA